MPDNNVTKKKHAHVCKSQRTNTDKHIVKINKTKTIPYDRKDGDCNLGRIFKLCSTYDSCMRAQYYSHSA